MKTWQKDDVEACLREKVYKGLYYDNKDVFLI